ncbi:lytic transglycosylase domain-containing protein [Pararhizobium sp. PWRC1-1]|uniref:lytic transglycosylase domain-containing protein n=1 Tax=Pararhizobium sp. PWRC1-1 TaxID=2804566 RepID=UPI003CF5AFED
MLKLLSASFVATLFAAWAFPSYSFDTKRFSTENLGSLETVAFGFYPEDQLQKDQFEVAPSGRIDKIPNGATMNIISAELAKASKLKAIHSDSRSDANPDLNMNTQYSDLSAAPQPNDECGSSAMTATEIEVLVGKTAQTYGVDPGLAKAIVWAESRFDQTRNSDQGALGGMQIIPRAALGLGVHDICDPASNIDRGVRHLKLMLDEFQNPILAVAAYNAGARAVYDHGGVPPFPEAVRYVAAVINHHMGLQMPRTSSALGVAAPSASALSDEVTSDVIGARGSRFVKGVMQF